MKIREMALLVRVAETGSMTQAARQLDLTPAAVSAAVQRVEAALGLRVFERTTRTLHPTQEGLVILEACQDVVRRWSRALDEARGDTATLEGTIRLSAPSDTSFQLVSEFVASFCSRHPRVRVVVHPTDTMQNVLEEALDLSIRYGALEDSSLVARTLARSPRVLVASPSYLAAKGTPSSVADLAKHRLLTLQLRNSPETTWSIQRGDTVTVQPIDSAMCGDGLMVRRWAVDGHGVAFKSLLDVVDDLEAGRLEHVMPGVTGGVWGVHVVFPSRQFISARVRGLADGLADAFRERSERCEAWLGRP